MLLILIAVTAAVMRANGNALMFLFPLTVMAIGGAAAVVSGLIKPLKKRPMLRLAAVIAAGTAAGFIGNAVFPFTG